MEYTLYVATLAAYFAGLAVCMRLVVGDCGIVSRAHGAFFGIGAYLPVVLNNQFQTGIAVGIGAAALVGLLAGYLLARIATRIHDDYLVIFTLAFQLVFTSLIQNGGAWTGGPTGLAAPPIIGGAGPVLFLMIAVALLAVVMALSLRLQRSPFGRNLIAVRDDETFAQSVGKDTTTLKASALAVSAGMTALLGAFYGGFIGFIDPQQFAVGQSVSILSMVIIGGASRISGAVLGAVGLVLLPEILRAIGLSGNLAGNLRQIAFGLLLFLLVWLRPTGFARADARQAKL